MPVYKDPRQIKEVSLPSVPDSKIKLYSSILAGEASEVMKVENDFERGLKFLALLIQDWNLTDEKGNKLSFEATVRNFSLSDITFLLNQTELGKEVGRKGGK